MKKLSFLFLVILLTFTGCGKSVDDVRKMSKDDQKEYLHEKYQLDLPTMKQMSDEQFAELLELHLEGLFDKKGLNQAWKEFANLNNADSEKYIHENFQDYKNMGMILSVYGPQFYNK